ncbi:hypothetical protein POM88_023119 [Heracleum sosnowskyi]|uniref:Uncharacterized protein n=1 Tax=Heracleum sosnowskyi TaxID=360622 RepID=A0AAD8MUB0_9APIA|nr:hypothetical protein POM88_023119 [Heracleum sosnowskyi]
MSSPLETIADAMSSTVEQKKRLLSEIASLSGMTKAEAIRAACLFTSNPSQMDVFFSSPDDDWKKEVVFDLIHQVLSTTLGELEVHKAFVVGDPGYLLPALSLASNLLRRDVLWLVFFLQPVVVIALEVIVTLLAAVGEPIACTTHVLLSISKFVLGTKLSGIEFF